MKNNHSIDIPLVFFAFALFIILFGLFSKYSFQKDVSVSQKTLNAIPASAPKSQNKLNYTLPIVCDYQTKDSSISATMDASLITATLKDNKGVQRYVVERDCLYSWNTNEQVGKKKCGVGNAIAMGKQLLSSGIGSIDSIASMFPKSQGSSPVDLQAVFETCKNVGEVKKEVFVLPSKINFVE